MSNKVSSICPICRAKEIDIILKIPRVPVLCNILWSSRKKAKQVATQNIKLGFCNNCGHIFNTSFESELISYTQGYENSLYFSLHFQNYTKSLATYLVNRYSLYGKNIIEIGCGDGDFLKLLCELGNNRGIGIDPAYSPQKSENNNPTEKISFIHDFYSEHYSSYKADFICARHVLEHIQNPYDFLSTMRYSIGKRFKTAVFIEVPNVLFILQNLGIWDLIYEHYSYFSPYSLSYLFENCGFKVYDLKETYSAQYLTIEALPVKDAKITKRGHDEGLKNLSQFIAGFSENYNKKIDSWQHKLKKLKEKGERVVIWGGGSKGVNFLNILEIQNFIDYVVDINPRKQGKYISGTGQKIVPPKFLKIYKPDVIIVMNKIYKDEIQQILKMLYLTPDILSA